MIAVDDWGTIPYRLAWERQEALRQQRLADTIDDTLILCEHPRVFTTGRQDCSADWRADAATIAQAGIEVVPSNRGGRVTYHGPGQLVGYCIFNLHARKIGVREFVTQVEELLIRTLAHFQILAGRDAAYPGVWVGQQKVAALGLHISHGVTLHGFALNYAPQLSDYQYIVPCGIQQRGVTSIAALRGGNAPTRADVVATLCRMLTDVFPERSSSYSAASNIGPTFTPVAGGCSSGRSSS
ncbi:MAG: lipoyl(octanoyl) transferase LipB [Deltaproteobacteria bacterium]|nr:lipoyl(octanoyl) transferase LipB [Deltaproteobacteria bacterium]